MDKKIKTLLTIIFAFGFISIGGYYLVQRANAATPQDPLFPLDKFTESVTRLITLDPVKKAEFEQEVLDERIAELAEIAEEEGDIEDSINEIEDQEDNIDEALTEEDIASNDEAKVRIIEQTQQQTTKHVTTMNKVQTQVGNDTAEQNIIKITSRIQDRSQERIEKLQESIDENEVED